MGALFTERPGSGEKEVGESNARKRRWAFKY
jgi:hypothetical protein